MSLIAPPADRPVFFVHASVVITDGDRVLFVEEGKPSIRNRWNLPGGHLDHGESPIDGAVREAAEEVCLTVNASYLVGIYASHKAVRFVMAADLREGAPQAGDEILSIKWMRWDELFALPDEQLVSPATLRLIRDDMKRENPIPLNAVRHVV